MEETGQGVACRILEVQQEKEDVFKGDLSFLVLKDTTEVIEIQVWVTRVINTQLSV